jgi:hypothetical protein
MTLHLGKTLCILESTSSAFAWFHGETQRMQLISLSLFFLQISLFAPRLATDNA